MSSTGFWTGNVKTPKKKEGGKKEKKRRTILPQHTLTVEVAGVDGQRYDEDHNDDNNERRRRLNVSYLKCYSYKFPY